MRILDKYLTKEFVYAVIGCLATFALLYIVVDLLSSLQDIVKNHIPWSVLKDYYLSLLPVIFVQTSPISILLSTLYCLGKLSHNNEIIAMRSSGLSITQIVIPLIAISLIFSCVVFLINEKVLPQTSRAADELREEKITLEKDADKRANDIVRNVTVFGTDNRLIFISKFNKKDKAIEDITVLEQDRFQNITAKIIANNGKWVEGTTWKLFQTIIYNFESQEPSEVTEPIFKEEYVMDLRESPRDLLRKKINVKNMNIKEISEYMKKVEQTNCPSLIQALSVELNSKIAFPFTALIICLVGIPFGFMSKRRGTAITSLGLCIGISFLYYVVSAVGIALGVAGVLYPILAAWVANIIFAAIGLMLISRLP